MNQDNLDKEDDSPMAGLVAVRLTDAGRHAAEAYRATRMTQVLTILLSDLVDSTRQQSELGNMRAFEITVEHRRIFRELLSSFDGQEVGTAGDAFLVVFAMPSEGIRFALHMQAAMRRARNANPELPLVRCGLHQGQIVVERRNSEVGSKAMDIFGLQISTAARITDLAAGGQILCTRNVGDDARAILRGDDLEGIAEVAWRNHGPYNFKGVDDAYEVCEVGEAAHAPLEAPAAGAKSWPLGQGDDLPGWRPSVGQVVPETNWQLEEKLGEGQFGEVWQAFNSSTRTRQVFKFTFKRSQVSALKREARLLYRLREYRHPALVEVYDVTEGERPLHYLEMEYVDGPTMAEWIATAPSLEARIDVIARIAEVLEVVHQASIYHRDIKPANILLQRKDDGSIQPKLADFGVGAAEDADLLKTLYASKTDHRAGTWDYIAPELKSEALSDDGHRPKASPQSDLYALGLTLYQLVTGDLQALPGPGWEGKIPTDELREDIAACMATAPKERPASGGELAQRLRQHAQRTQARRIQRLRRTAFVAAGIAFLAFGIAVFSGYQWQQAQEQRRMAQEERARAEEQQGIADRERKQAVEERSEARRQLYFSSILQAQAQLEAGRYDLARNALWQAPVEHSNWEWGHLALALYPALYVLEGNESQLRFAAFSPDGERIFAASDDGTVRLWDGNTGAESGLPNQYEGPVLSVFLNIGSPRIITASEDGSARVWDGETGREVLVLEGHEEQVWSAAFSPDGRRVVTASPENTVRVWDAESGAMLQVLDGHEDWVRSTAFSPDGTRVVTASNDGTARVWDVETGESLLVLTGHASDVGSAAFRPDGRRIVTTSSDGTALIWDAETGAIAQMLGGRPDRFYYSASFSPDGGHIVTASRDGTAQVWDANSGTLLEVLQGHEDRVSFASFSPDGGRIVTASWDGTVQLWGGAIGAESQLLEGHTDWVRFASFSPDGGRIVTASHDGTVRLWDANTGMTLDVLEGHEDRALYASFSPDGGRIVTVSDVAVRMWDGNTGAALKVLEGHGAGVHFAAFSPDSTRVVTASYDGSARVWDAGIGAPLEVLDGHEDMVLHASFSPDGGRIVTTVGSGPARLWDRATGEVLQVLEGKIASASFSSDGARIVTASYDGVVSLWDGLTGEAMEELEGNVQGILSASFSPDGGRIVGRCLDGTVHLWDGATGANLRVLRGHTHSVEFAGFSPDGTRIVTASEDGTARVWDGATGAALQLLEGHNKDVVSAAFSPDSTRIVTASFDNTARLWMAAPWRLEDLPKVEGDFENPEAERKARFFEWKRHEYQRWMKIRKADGDATHEP